MLSDGVIANGVAPSFYIEGLLYSAPNAKLGTSYADSFVDSLN